MNPRNLVKNYQIHICPTFLDATLSEIEWQKFVRKTFRPKWRIIKWVPAEGEAVIHAAFLVKDDLLLLDEAYALLLHLIRLSKNG
jgi:hypothetical protein